MPHLILEYTNNLPAFDVQQALIACNTVLIESGHFEGPDIKSRAVRLDSFMVGDDSVPTGFVHVTLRLLDGRSPVTKGMLANDLLSALHSLVHTENPTALQLSVEICDMELSSYAKYAT